MSFNIKGKTIYLSLISLVTFIITITFCVMVIIDGDTYGETMKNVMLVVIGYFFNHENKLREREVKTNE